MALTFTS